MSCIYSEPSSTAIPATGVIKLEYSLQLQIKHNDWLLADTCPQAANHCALLYPPQTLFVGGILFSRCPSVRPCVRACVRPSVTFCFLNNLKSHCWIFIKPCKHVHICKTNTLDKKVRTRGQFYLSYFPL